LSRAHTGDGPRSAQLHGARGERESISQERASATYPALGVLELTSIARGFVVADAMLKRAEVELLWSRPITPGKHVIIVGGGEEDVAQAMQAGQSVATDLLIDRLYLPGAHPALGPAIAGTLDERALASVGIVEVSTVASTVLGADAACKAATVILREMQLARGIGGKGFFVLSGLLEEIQAALDAARRAVDSQHWVGSEIIANPHDDFGERLLR
jgi:bacterial microcompartment shell protein